MLRPSLRHLKNQNPNVNIHILTTSMCSKIWDELQEEFELTIHEMNSSSPVSFVTSILKTILKLRRFRFDSIIDFELFFRTSAMISGLLRADSRAGYYRYNYEGLYRGTFYDRTCAFNQNAHIASNFLALTKTAELQDPDTPNLKAQVTSEELLLPPQTRFANRSEKSLHRTIVICPDVGPTLSVRNYPLVSLISVVEKIKTRFPDFQIQFVGTQDDGARLKATSDGTKLLSMGQDLTGQLKFNELVDVIAQAELLICNDNGPAHFAVLSGTKTVALFSTDSPFMYGPLGETTIAYSYFHCSPCISALNHKTTSCSNNKCLQGLSPEFVFKLVSQTLENKLRPRTINGLQDYLNPSVDLKRTLEQQDADKTRRLS